MRGLAAAARLQGQYRSAIKHLECVLEISKAMQEYTGGAQGPLHSVCTALHYYTASAGVHRWG